MLQHWDARSQIIAHFIRPGERVIDLGAGDQKLRRHLPPGCSYIGVDIADDHPDTFVVDFNAEFKLPEGPFDVVVSAGFIEHIPEWNKFMGQLATQMHGSYFLLTYYFGNESPFPRPSTVEECQREFGKYVGGLREVARFHSQSMFTGVLARDAGYQRPITPLLRIDQATAHIPKQRRPFLQRRLAQLKRLLGRRRQRNGHTFS